MAYIVTNDAIKEELENMNKTYEQNRNLINETYEKSRNYFNETYDSALSSAKQSAATNLGEAKEAFQRNALGNEFVGDLSRKTIETSQYSYNSKNQLYKINQNDIDEAFESYKRNYLSQKDSIMEDYSEKVQNAAEFRDAGISSAIEFRDTSLSAVNEALDEEADYVRRVADSAYGYLKWRYENDPESLSADPYLGQFVSNGELVDETLFNEGDDVIQGIYKDDGEGHLDLTDYGKEVYRQLLQSPRNGKGNSYSDYLMRDKNGKGADEDLFEWLRTESEAEDANTNLDMVTKLLELDDSKYSGFYTLSKTQREALVNRTEFKDKFDTAKAEKDVGKFDDYTKGLYDKAINELEAAYNSVGQGEEYQKIKDEYADLFTKYDEFRKSSDEFMKKYNILTEDDVEKLCDLIDEHMASKNYTETVKKNFEEAKDDLRNGKYSDGYSLAKVGGLGSEFTDIYLKAYDKAKQYGDAKLLRTNIEKLLEKASTFKTLLPES